MKRVTGVRRNSAKLAGGISIRPSMRRFALTLVLLRLALAGFVANADTYSTDESNLVPTYDYGPPYSYPRDLLSWHVSGNWDPPGSYYLEETEYYKVSYWDSGGSPLGSWDETYRTTTWLTPPVDTNRSNSYTGRITAGTHKPANAVAGQYYYDITSTVVYAWVDDNVSTYPGRTITFP